ncbi:hypothetical protein [Amycolatopsis sp. NPDC050768]|uniref:hypothetical protein n=1 Tax=Amycolatopsis sp. NPDC050768 TaxID=3154839 RepID=UPI003400E463
MENVTTRREEARADRAAVAEQRRADEAAQRAEEREDRRLEFEQKRAAEAAKQQRREEAREERKAGRARAAKSLVAAVRAHALDLLFVPVIFVPAILAWSAMAAYGKQVFGPVGVLLPLFSEAAMWAFAGAVTLEVRRGEPTGWLKVGVWVFAAVAAALNFLHGYSTGHHWDTGVVMAVVSIGGVAVHQLITARPSAARADAGAGTAAPTATVQPDLVQPVSDERGSVQSEPVQAESLDASSAPVTAERTAGQPGSVQPQAENTRGGEAEKTDRPVAVASSPKRDRARASARRHQALHGSLPTVDELMTLAEVSRGTAGTALQELRQQPAPLHVITDITTHQANS